jgi:biopolymer transport protein ExbB/TolQ
MQVIIDVFNRGGVGVMVGITITALASLIIIIERSFRLWVTYDLPNSGGFVIQVQKMVMNNSIENAIRLCKKVDPKLLPYVLAQGLKKANHSPEEVDLAVEHAILAVSPKVTRGVGFLSTTANVATLLGLLGTIFGLMHSFDAAAKATGSEKQTLLAEGIAEALTATSYGLGTALFCLFAYGVLAAKQKGILDDINQHSAKLKELLYTRKNKIESASAE